jgi:cell division protein FtsA
MSSNIIVGLDIGTSTIRTVICKASDNGHTPEVIAHSDTPAFGIRHGYITNHQDAVKSIRRSIKTAEKSLNSGQVKKVFLGAGGIGLSSFVSTGAVMITRADSEITQTDLEAAVVQAREQLPLQYIQNRRILHESPVDFYIDGQQVHGHPVGLKGVRLEAKILFVTLLEPHIQGLIEVVEDAGYEIIDVVAAPLAASFVSLTKAERIAGCLLVNIGSETLSIITYADDKPISLEVFQIGGNDITNDIALGLQVSLEDAEVIKKDHDKGENHGFSKKKLDDIVSARLTDMFDLVEAHLKRIGKNGMLPAGIIITGGGSRIATVDDVAKAYLKLPSKIAKVTCLPEDKNCSENTIKVKDATWAVSYGLCVYGSFSDDDSSISMHRASELFSALFKTLMRNIKRFLP